MCGLAFTEGLRCTSGREQCTYGRVISPGGDNGHLRITAESPMGAEEIGRLEAAYEQTLRTIGLKDRNDPITEMIAKQIIEIAQIGVRDPAQISALAIKEIGIP